MLKVAVSLIIENSKGEILLLLRDDKPEIPFPNQWYILGGSAEEGESPEGAIRREIKEEINLDLQELSSPVVYDWPEKTEHVYSVRMDLDLGSTPLNEGQRLKYFSRQEIKEMELAFHDKEIALRYFAARNMEGGETKQNWKLS